MLRPEAVLPVREGVIGKMSCHCPLFQPVPDQRIIGEELVFSPECLDQVVVVPPEPCRLCPGRESPQLLRALSFLTVDRYERETGKGGICLKVPLSQIHGLGQAAVLILSIDDQIVGRLESVGKLFVLQKAFSARMRSQKRLKTTGLRIHLYKHRGIQRAFLRRVRNTGTVGQKAFFQKICFFSDYGQGKGKALPVFDLRCRDDVLTKLNDSRMIPKNHYIHAVFTGSDPFVVPSAFSSVFVFVFLPAFPIVFPIVIPSVSPSVFFQTRNKERETVQKPGRRHLFPIA